MKFELSVQSVKTIRSLPDYWTEQDYRNLLEAFELDGFENADASELQDLLFMAISDLEPDESAVIILRYKLGGKLKEGQLKNLSHSMTGDNESEEYPDISLHYPLFNINQLLFKAYNGVFTNAKASRIEIELTLPSNPQQAITKEIALKALSTCLGGQNLILRLYEDQLSGKVAFTEAEHIIWTLEKTENDRYVVLTSDYWINKEDIVKEQSNGMIPLFK